MGLPGCNKPVTKFGSGAPPPKNKGNSKNDNFKIDPVDSKSGLVVSFDAYSFAVIILVFVLKTCENPKKN